MKAPSVAEALTVSPTRRRLTCASPSLPKTWTKSWRKSPQLSATTKSRSISKT
jgi:hypothetical protein